MNLTNEAPTLTSEWIFPECPEVWSELEAKFGSLNTLNLTKLRALPPSFSDHNRNRKVIMASETNFCPLPKPLKHHLRLIRG
ncbi:hypothetical protein CEXT_790491 [Caerostris extrusa]|uniref:Uncharacterized protein n=1 Tax=Caerostris extrusa TaxID=172846 RepID=A0AAV4WFS5_CAEEX|nr:hypothetical protein CEXT_790491 [Caerostris extrusa]